jgi:hypothetical protein
MLLQESLYCLGNWDSDYKLPAATDEHRQMITRVAKSVQDVNDLCSSPYLPSCKRLCDA